MTDQKLNNTEIFDISKYTCWLTGGADKKTDSLRPKRNHNKSGYYIKKTNRVYQKRKQLN